MSHVASDLSTSRRGHQPNDEYELQKIKTATNGPDAVPSSTNAPSIIAPARNKKRIWVLAQAHIRYVPTKAARDHLANERVFLAYIRAQP